MSPEIRWIYQGTVVHACFLNGEDVFFLLNLKDFWMTAWFFAEKAEVSQLFLFICVPDVGFCPETAGVEYLVCFKLIGWFLLVEASGFRRLMVWGDFVGGGITGFGVLCDDPEGWLDCWIHLISSFSRPDFCLPTVWTQKVNKKITWLAIF